MANSLVTYAGDGVETHFTLPFSYLHRDHLTVLVDGVALFNYQYVFLTDNLIELSQAPDGESQVTIRRNTPIDKLIVDFSGGYILAKDLNAGNLQLLLALQEVLEQSLVGLIHNGFGLDLTDPQYAKDVALEIINELVAAQLYQDFQEAVGSIDSNSVSLQDALVSLGLNTETLDGHDARIRFNQAERITDDETLAGLVKAIEASISDSNARIVNEEVTRATATEALTGRIRTTQATLRNADARITREEVTRATIDSALAGRAETIEASLGEVSASVEDVAAASATTDSALAGRLTIVEAEADSNAAAVTTEAATRAGADDTLASQITTVKTTVGDNTAIIQVQTQSIDGIMAQRAVVIDVNGRVSGTALIGGGGKSAFEITADKFAVYDPDTDLLSMGYINGRFIVNGHFLGVGSVLPDKLYVEYLSALSADIGLCTAGTFRTASSGYRTEISSKGDFPLWYGTGVKNASNGLLYADKTGKLTVNALEVIGTDNIATGAVTAIYTASSDTVVDLQRDVFTTVLSVTAPRVDSLSFAVPVLLAVTLNYEFDDDDSTEQASIVIEQAAPFFDSNFPFQQVIGRDHIPDGRKNFTYFIKGAASNEASVTWHLRVSLGGDNARKVFARSMVAEVHKV